MIQNGHCTKENYSKMYLMTLLVMRERWRSFQKETKNYKMPGNNSDFRADSSSSSSGNEDVDGVKTVVMDSEMSRVVIVMQ